MAGRWPLHEVLLARDWQEQSAIVHLIVARRSGMGQIAAGTFLVDLGYIASIDPGIEIFLGDEW